VRCLVFSFAFAVWVPNHQLADYETDLNCRTKVGDQHSLHVRAAHVVPLTSGWGRVCCCCCVVTQHQALHRLVQWAQMSVCLQTSYCISCTPPHARTLQDHVTHAPPACWGARGDWQPHRLPGLSGCVIHHRAGRCLTHHKWLSQGPAAVVVPVLSPCSPACSQLCCSIPHQAREHVLTTPGTSTATCPPERFCHRALADRVCRWWPASTQLHMLMGREGMDPSRTSPVMSDLIPFMQQDTGTSACLLPRSRSDYTAN
jgi:hypothetical protein